MNRDRAVPAAAGAPGLPGAGAGMPGGMGGGDQLSAIRQMVQQNPAMIQPLLQQIATEHPELAQLIAQNPEALYELLGGGGGEGDDDDEFGEGPVMRVNLTQEEAAAVERVSQSVYRILSDFSALADGIYSSKHSGSTVKQCFRHTCFATRTKNWLLTFCLRTWRRINNKELWGVILMV